MQKFNFENDYSECGCSEIIQAIARTNLEKVPAYGADRYCESAKKRIREACNCPEAEIFFLTGGTQTNQVVIDSLLLPYQGVVAPATGHINGHEAGAIEFTGHKVLPIAQTDGKISADGLCKYLMEFMSDGNKAHMVQPGMVYISFPTEYGTLYSQAELKAIYTVCREFSLPLFIDGARMGYGLASRASDVTLADIARYCDVFYIGGTKVGALFGEAVVFTKKNMPRHFLTIVKQHGALLAKGRLLGLQFDVLFSDDTYMKLSRNAIETADRLKEILFEKGYRFFLNSPTNQIFIVLDDSRYAQLSEVIRFSFWEKYDSNHTVVRLATSWATSMEEIEALAQYL